jgi:hypothetical protein
MDKPWTTLYPTKRRAVNAARRAYGACRYGDVAAVFSVLPEQARTHGAPVGYVVCPRDNPPGWIADVHNAAGFLPQHAARLLPVYHDTLKG